MPHKDPEAKKAYYTAYNAARREDAKRRTREWRDSMTPEQRVEQRAKAKAYREANKAKIAEWNTQWRAENRETLLAKKKADYETNKEQIKAKQKAERDAMPPLMKELRRQKCRDHYKENGHRQRAAMREKWRNDPEYRKKSKTTLPARKRAYRARERIKRESRPLIYRECDACGERFVLKKRHGRFCSRKCYRHFSTQFFNQQRRTQIEQTGGRIAPEQWRDILRYFNWRCAYCGAKGSLTIDHLEPLVRGGTHDPYNLVPACRRCNQSKHACNLIEFVFLRPLGFKLKRGFAHSGRWRKLYVPATETPSADDESAEGERM